MKVLHINVVYKKGSTGKITYDIHKCLLEKGIESVVCYGRGELISEPGVYKICPEWYSKLNNAWSRITGIMYGGCFFSTNKLISIIKKERPDIVHLQCINGYFVNVYRIVNWLKKHHIKTVLTLHAEFMHTANCGHAFECDKWKCGCGNCSQNRTITKSIFFDNTAYSWKKMKTAFDGFNNIVVASVSPWLMNRAKQSPILTDKQHVVVLNGLDTTVFHPYETTGLRKKNNCENKKIVFHATASFSTEPNHIKGGWYICELARKLRNVQFIVAGTIAEANDVPENILLLGRLTDQVELARYYSMADVTVLTSKKETFSMVTAESLCCGTPIVGFKAGGPEQIAIPKYSKFVEYGDIENLYMSLVKVLNSEKKCTYIASESKARYSTEVMTENYARYYFNMIEG